VKVAKTTGDLKLPPGLSMRGFILSLPPASPNTYVGMVQN